MKALEILYTLISSGNDDVFANKNYYEKLTFIAQAIEELEELQNRILQLEAIETDFIMKENRSCSSCIFNSSKDKSSELITCDKSYAFVNQRVFGYCGKWENKR